MGDYGYLVFLSHKAEVKSQIYVLKQGLEEYGVEAFVAHADIDPGTEWQEEILGALEVMDAFVPVLTEGFRDSQWTDQEVGYAIARGVRIIPLRLGVDPYGFMGKYQGLTCDWEDAPEEIIRALMVDPAMVDAYIDSLTQCPNYATANKLAGCLENIQDVTPNQVSNLMSAFNNNQQIYKSWGFNGLYPVEHGQGLAEHLSNITGKAFEIEKHRLSDIHRIRQIT